MGLTYSKEQNDEYLEAKRQANAMINRLTESQLDWERVARKEAGAKQTEDELKNIHKILDLKEAAAKSEFEQEQNLIYARKGNLKQVEEAQVELDRKLLAIAEERVKAAEQMAGKESEEYVRSAEKRNQLQKKLSMDSIRVELERVDALIAAQAIYSDAWIYWTKYKVWLETNSAEKVKAVEKQALAERAKYYEEYWKLGAIGDEVFYQHMYDLAMQGKMTWQDFRDKVVENWGTVGEQIRLGLRKAKEEISTFGQTIVKLAKDFPEKFASGMSSAIMDFVKGTKTAKEAARDFFTSMISWIMEAILKQQILNLLMGSSGGGSASGGILGTVTNLIGGLFGGYNTGGFTSAGGAYWNPSLNLPFHHTGGIIGIDNMPMKRMSLSVLKDAIYAHDGYNTLAADEIPIIARKNERIYTPEQDAARRGTTEVKFEFINNTGNANLRTTEGPTKQQGSGYIKQVWLTEMKMDKTFNRQAKNILGL
jgi:hypothetical protein